MVPPAVNGDLAADLVDPAIADRVQPHPEIGSRDTISGTEGLNIDHQFTDVIRPVAEPGCSTGDNACLSDIFSEWEGDRVKVSAQFQLALADYAVKGKKGVVGERVGTSIKLTANLTGSVQ